MNLTMKTFNKILLLDDDPVSTHFNKYLIDKAGISKIIDVATSEQEGLSWICSNCHVKSTIECCKEEVLVFPDLTMTAMNRFEFFESMLNLKKNKVIEDLPHIYFLTSTLALESDMICGKYPVRGYLNKFLTDDDLNLLLFEQDTDFMVGQGNIK